jgi:A/G-specific adenine glycosylase
LIIEKRLEKDIWQGLYQFPMLELDTYEVSWDDLVHQPNNVYLHADDQLLKISKPFRQTLTHQYIVACFWEIQLSKAPVLLSPQQSLIPIWDVKVFAFPKIIDSYLQDSTLYLL